MSARSKPVEWKPWYKANPIPPSRERMEQMARRFGQSIEQVQAVVESGLGETIFRNNVYQVIVRKTEPVDGWPPMIHLSIKRLDTRQVGIERFRDFQRIKNELVGPECEGVELYPAESRLVDAAHQYHLFVIALSGVRLPFGLGV